MRPTKAGNRQPLHTTCTSPQKTTEGLLSARRLSCRYMELVVAGKSTINAAASIKAKSPLEPAKQNNGCHHTAGTYMYIW